MVVSTDSYHLHVATLEVAMETSIGRGLGLEVCIATAVAVVCDIIEGDLLFGIHDCSRGWVRRQGRREVGRSREGMQRTTRGEEAGEARLLCKRDEREMRRASQFCTNNNNNNNQNTIRVRPEYVESNVLIRELVRWLFG